jgi:hypothetical protein
MTEEEPIPLLYRRRRQRRERPARGRNCRLNSRRGAIEELGLTRQARTSYARKSGADGMLIARARAAARSKGAIHGGQRYNRR